MSSFTQYYEEKYFRVITNNYGALSTTTYWQNFPDSKAVGFTVDTKLQQSTIQIAKDWSIYQYILNKVLFRVDSEHSIDGTFFNVEMQLFHELDSTFISPGRQQTLPLTKLVISLFFKTPSTADEDVYSDLFFKFSNLNSFALGSTTAKFSRPIKLGNIVQNVPSYLYQGTYTYPNCDDIYWIVMTKYGIISLSDFGDLNTAIGAAGYKDGNGNNRRDVNLLFNSSNVYRNFNNINMLVPARSYFRYINGEYLMKNGMAYISLLSLIYLILFY